MAKMLSLCVLLVAHAFAASALTLGAGSIPGVSSGGSDLLSGVVSGVSPGGASDGLSGVSSGGASDGASGLLNIVSSDGGLLGLGTGPLDPVLGGILDGLGDGLTPVLNELAGNLLFGLKDVLDLTDPGLVDALADPLGLSGLTNQLTTALLGVVGNLTSVVVPDKLAYGRDVVEEARRFGLKAEKFVITTPDYFNLEVIEVLSECSCSDRVVIITSTAIMNSANFILLEDNSLVYKLARNCMKVYIVPFRGSRYGAVNTKLSRESPEFWNSTILELGIYDLRVGIEFVSKRTGSNSIRLITADIGAAALVAMNSALGRASPQCSLGRAYIIEAFVCMQHTESVVFAALTLIRDVLRVAGNLLIHNEIPLGDKPLHQVLFLLCGVVSPKVCDLLNKLLFGVTSAVDTTRFLYGFGYFPDNIQVSVAVQVFQTMRSDRCLAYFNYGPARNQELYNSEQAPAFDITATTVPVSLYFNEKSTLVPKEDWQTTYQSFRPSARNRISVIKDGNFLTHFLPKNPDTFFYNKLLADMEEDFRKDCISACTTPCPSGK